ncbi:MAG: hypothetical protein IJF83_15425, partial [Methanobrevibacter sp.]|nr:hypothetical protein [Methanobrevibacter sp.]
NFNENKNLKKEVIYKFFEKIFAKRKILKISSEKFKKSNYQLTNLQNLCEHVQNKRNIFFYVMFLKK